MEKEPYGVGKDKGPVRDRLCFYGDTEHFNNSITVEKINLTFLGRHKLKHQRRAAPREAENELQHRRSGVICLYGGSQRGKGHVFLNQHYKMDLWLWV